MSGFSVILAADRQMGIGKDGSLPWHLPGDMSAFRELTTGEGDIPNAVIMGRKTWESIPDRFRPLPARMNLVITSQSDFPLPDSVRRASDLDDALAQSGEASEIFVIGGAAVYADAFAHKDCATIYLTRVDADLQCDTSVPPLPERFALDGTSEDHDESGLTYRFEVYRIPGESQNA